VTPSGAGGEVTRDDVVKHASQASVFRNIETPEWPEVREETIPVAASVAEADPREESIPVRGVRKATAGSMVRSAYSAPHVTVWTDVDATRTMELVKRLKASPDYADTKVSPLLIMARAVIWAVRRTPMVNAAWVDGEDGAQIKLRHYVNLGIAAATPRGLIVPNIKDAQNLSMRELAKALERLTLTAREGKTPPADQQQGTITITNIGVFGMDAGTPIINPGEAGIIAMGTIRQKPWVVDGEVRPRYVTTVSGSFDHRVIDGDGMSRFIADVAAVLEEPALLVE
jgi:pyruvate dehydrogenase E2 component (dihydrolipoamide acetyltransferase)